MNRTCLAIALCLATGPAIAAAADHACSATSACGDCAGCPPCAAKICRPEVKTEKLKKTCYNVECKPICVPDITFPWEKPQVECGCAGCVGGEGACEGWQPRCGRVKYVKVFEKDSIEIGETCVCEWKIEDAPAACNCCELPGPPVPGTLEQPPAPNEHDAAPAEPEAPPAEEQMTHEPAPAPRRVLNLLKVWTR
ncbi:MAG: hypothetical protein KY476_04520 [Planctomycetes bacterium]|nr:hypothetical protein [Planctomycetota bacterium]